MYSNIHEMESFALTNLVMVVEWGTIKGKELWLYSDATEIFDMYIDACKLITDPLQQAKKT